MFKRYAALAVLSACISVTWADTAVVSTGEVHFTQRDGKELYDSVCLSCHMAEGKGAVGAGAIYPPLDDNPKLAASAYPLYMVMYGTRGMPGFGGVMDDEQIANVVNYIRTHFGNDYSDAIAEKDAKALRQEGYEYFDLN
ncbi:cytochrome c [Paenalcaligenes niemegkensis]|uniref:c-type cytochrome n=1 Tax=Paenalcaligenes niemegkensis TaxID=2895469 RepID=UPI001EE98560|nr:cytochrome c [Paenalcaligenes niemegkensis]MCQ9615799.1 cytochrome c [Paenalcaligenes niemegkensis]